MPIEWSAEEIEASKKLTDMLMGFTDQESASAGTTVPRGVSPLSSSLKSLDDLKKLAESDITGMARAYLVVPPTIASQIPMFTYLDEDLVPDNAWQKAASAEVPGMKIETKHWPKHGSDQLGMNFRGYHDYVVKLMRPLSSVYYAHWDDSVACSRYVPRPAIVVETSPAWWRFGLG